MYDAGDCHKEGGGVGGLLSRGLFGRGYGRGAGVEEEEEEQSMSELVSALDDRLYRSYELGEPQRT